MLDLRLWNALIKHACGGDAGGGTCEGKGASGIAYQGCSCSVDGGDVSNGDEFSVCPEDQGQDTQLCNATSCGGDTAHSGLCDLRTDIDNGLYRFCACCPKNQNLDCSSCGGDIGDGRCAGLAQYTGYQYYNCSCTTHDQSVSLHPNARRMILILI